MNARVRTCLLRFFVSAGLLCGPLFVSAQDLSFGMVLVQPAATLNGSFVRQFEAQYNREISGQLGRNRVLTAANLAKEVDQLRATHQVLQEIDVDLIEDLIVRSHLAITLSKNGYLRAARIEFLFMTGAAGELVQAIQILNGDKTESVQTIENIIETVLTSTVAQVGGFRQIEKDRFLRELQTFKYSLRDKKHLMNAGKNQRHDFLMGNRFKGVQVAALTFTAFIIFTGVVAHSDNIELLDPNLARQIVTGAFYTAVGIEIANWFYRIRRRAKILEPWKWMGSAAVGSCKGLILAGGAN